MATPEVRCKA